MLPAAQTALHLTTENFLDLKKHVTLFINASLFERKKERFALVVHFSVQAVSPSLFLSVHGHVIQAL